MIGVDFSTVTSSFTSLEAFSSSSSSRAIWRFMASLARCFTMKSTPEPMFPHGRRPASDPDLPPKTRITLRSAGGGTR